MIAAVLGWIGAVGTFVAYLLVSRGWLRASSWRYGLLNTCGGLLGGLAAALYGAWPSVASNVVWAVVGAMTVISATRRPLVAESDRTVDPNTAAPPC